MGDPDLIRALLESRRRLGDGARPLRKADAEGGCGVIGIASSDRIAGRHLLQALAQMRNRGNGKGGGIAAVGLDARFFGVRPHLIREDYLIAVALLDEAARPGVEAEFIEPTFEVDHVAALNPVAPDGMPALDVPPPAVVCYFARVRPDVRDRFVETSGLAGVDPGVTDDEIVYQNSYALNRACYSSVGEKRAFVLSHAKDLLVLKMVGYGDDVVRCYGLGDLRAHVWIGHHRYPTKGRVWHPGGAHPFIGMREALVHNGDFANYASISAYLAERNIHPLFLTDTEVAVQVFDLLHRVYGYPLEYVIEAMAPTTERDFERLPPERQIVYRMLQAVHIHASPDGPWFFLLAQSIPERGISRLIGITDTSMLRPQVFALQEGRAAVGFAASEKQAIDAALESLAAEDSRFWPGADRYWNARGGSHTDGGAFLFTVEHHVQGTTSLVCSDKFGRVLSSDPRKVPPRAARVVGASYESYRDGGGAGAAGLATEVEPRIEPADLAARAASSEAYLASVGQELARWGFAELGAFTFGLEQLAENDPDDGRRAAIETLTHLIDRRLPTGSKKPSGVRALAEASLGRIFLRARGAPSGFFTTAAADAPLPEPRSAQMSVVVDSRGYPPEGPDSLARAVVSLAERGFRHVILAGTRGHRFIGCGLGPETDDLRLDVYGSPGDYLASGTDGAEIVVHASGQDQLGQILKRGRLVVHGDVGQTFMYGAKGGEIYVRGNAAGRPLINAVGRPRVVINGTCLDYLAESFMAGDPLDGGGFVALNGIAFDEDGVIRDLESPYPGGNLFSLASGGAIYVRDPRGLVGDDQLNGGAFAALTAADWELIRPHLEENERLFGIPVSRLLEVDGRPERPERVYRKIAPVAHHALAPEEAWVRPET